MNVERISSDETEAGGIFFGWWVVLSAFLISAVTIGAYYSFGVFFLPIIEEFGWSRGLVSGVILVGGITYALIVPLTGLLADRIGFRVITTITAVIVGIAFILSSLVQNVWHLYLFVGILAGLGAPACIALPLSLVARWFRRRQGLALGIATTGIGVGTALIPPLAAYIIAEYGWRPGYVVIGMLVGVICIPAALLTMREPDPEYVRDFEGEETMEGSNGAEDMSLGDALGTSSFWYLFFVFAILIFCLGLAFTHLVPYARDSGMTAVAAAGLLTVIGVFSIIGRLASGAISDRIGARPVLIVGIIIQGIMILWLVKAETGWMFYLFAVMFGLSYGGNIVLVPKLTSRIFGLTAMGSIYGALSVADGLGYGTGPWLAGYIHDITGSYHISFYMVAAGLLLAVFLAFALKEKSAGKTMGD